MQNIGFTKQQLFFLCKTLVLLSKNMFFCADPNSQRTKKTKKNEHFRLWSQMGVTTRGPQKYGFFFVFFVFFWFPGVLVIHKTVVFLSKNLFFYATHLFF